MPSVEQPHPVVPPQQTSPPLQPAPPDTATERTPLLFNGSVASE